jgi:Mn-dependent DtxR family transcriptional regulator
LEKKGLVERISNLSDKRSNVISLTKKGREAAKRHKKYHDKMEERLFAGLTEGEKEHMMATLEKLHANLDGDSLPHFHFHGGHFGFGQSDESGSKRRQIKTQRDK